MLLTIRHVAIITVILNSKKSFLKSLFLDRSICKLFRKVCRHILYNRSIKNRIYIVHYKLCMP